MIGTLDSGCREVTVVGAGVAGLLAADALDRAGYVVTLIEASPDRAGGLVSTRETPWGPSETAAHSLLVTPPVAELCARLGVELVPVRPESRARYVWRGGKLRRFPLSVGEALRALARAYLVLADGDRDPARQTLETWARRHLGEPALKYLLTPFLRGIYGARPSEISVGLAFPALVVPQGHSLLSLQLHKLRKRWFGGAGNADARPSRRRKPRMMAPRDGMGAIVGALERSLRGRLGERFRLGQRLDRLPAGGNLVLCVPAPEAARLLEPEAGAGELAAALREVTYSPLVSVTAFVERPAFNPPPRGVGVLLPEGTGRKTLGVLFNSSSFAGRVRDESQWVSLTAMLGGSSHPELPSFDEERIRAVVREDLEKVLDLAPGARIETAIHRWERAVPRYDDALGRAWEIARAGWCSRPGRLLFGNYTGQVSIRGMMEVAAGFGVEGQGSL